MMPAQMPMPINAMSTAMAHRPAIITVRLLILSASRPPTGATANELNPRAEVTIPSQNTDPVMLYMSHPRATTCISIPKSPLKTPR